MSSLTSGAGAAASMNTRVDVRLIDMARASPEHASRATPLAFMSSSQRMASIGHVFVGLAIARAHDSRASQPQPASLRARIACTIAFPVLALLPDGDVVAFALRIPYEHELGHR